MRILFLNPPFKTEYGRFSRTSRSPAICKGGTIYYPIWLAYVAGVLEEAGHEIRLVDACAYGYDGKKTCELAKEFNPALIVLDTSTPSIHNDGEMGSELKEALPNSLVVLMGTHPTALPTETLALNNGIDAVVRGEAEYTINELADKLSQFGRNVHEEVFSGILGLSYRIGNDIFHNPDRPQIEDLDRLPFLSKVYKRHLDVKKYFFAASDYPEIQLITSRGCPYRCFFCVYPQTVHRRKFRMRSAQNVADEFQWVVENLPEVREIGIEDDTFTANKKRTIDFCQEIVRRGIRIKWYCNVRADLDLETMRLMRRAGCVLVTVGYESGDQEVLNQINKNLTVEQIKRFSVNCKRAGLMVHSCFMVGNRGETKESLRKTLELAKKLNDDTMQFFPLMVYPGTEAYEWARNNQLLTVKRYDEWTTKKGLHNTVIKMDGMTPRELVEWCDRARREYYLRPSYILYKLLQQFARPSEIRRTARSLRVFARHLISGSFKDSERC